MNRSGLLVVFSGLDGAGKSTQIAMLVSQLRANAQEPKVIWTRGGYTPLFEALKGTMRHVFRERVVPASGHSPQRERALKQPRTRRFWLALALIDLLLVYGVHVRWLCWRGRMVICDRYLWDTLIDFRLNFPQERVEDWGLWRLLVKVSPQPDVAFLLLIPIEESLRRSLQKQEPFPDSSETLSLRLAQYLALAENGCWHVIDGRRPMAELAAEISMAVKSM